MGGIDSSALPQIILFGDSLTEWGFDKSTEGFGWALETQYKGKVEIINEGYAGYTILDAKPKFQRLIARTTQRGAPPVLLITIFFGANDACLIGDSEYVPLPTFELNIRRFVNTILALDQLACAKIILITPPPINIDDHPSENDASMDLGPAVAAAMSAARENPKEGRGYRTYLSKKKYAEKIMQIAREYEQTGRVVGCDYWTALVHRGLQDQGRLADEDKYDLERLPGCGLKMAQQFGEGYFTDELHLDKLAYNVLTDALMDVVLSNLPELAPERIFA